jgi:hypothetical protein
VPRSPVNVRHLLRRTVHVAAVVAVASAVVLLASVALLTPPVGAQPYSHSASSLHVSSKSVPAGSKVAIAGSGFAAYSSVSVYVHSSPVFLATTTADAHGAISTSVSLPGNLPPGGHTLTATGPAAGGGTSTLAVGITVGGRGERSGGISGTAGAAVAGGVLLLAIAGGLTLVTIRRRHA